MQFSRRIRVICRRSLTIALALITAISLSACNPATLKRQTSQDSQVVRAILSDPTTFNPILSTDATVSRIFAITNPGLTTSNPITGEIEPELAESWEVSEDKRKIVFTLRKGLKWSDGHPLTADDVIFTYNDLVFNKDIPTSSKDLLRIGQSRKLPKLRKIDNLRIEFTLPEPFSPILNATSLEILPTHILRETIEKKDSQGKPLFLSAWNLDTPPEKIITSGSYKIKAYVPSERVILERNPYYWKKDEQGNQLPHIDRVFLPIVENLDTFLLQFRSGSLDSVSVSPQYYSLLKREEKRGKFTIYNGGPAYGTTFFFFNLNKGRRDGKPLVAPVKSRWFNNVKFRQAVAYAVDRQTMINNIYRGLGQPQNTQMSIQSPYYDSSIKGYDYNPQKAKKLLLEAGFKYNNTDELLDAEGNRVRFTLNTNAGNTIREAIGVQIQQDLNKIGIRVDFKPLAWNNFIDKLSNSLDWECGLLGLTGGNEPNGGANVWFPDSNLHMFNQKPGAGQKPIEGREVADWEKKIAYLYIEGAKEFDIEKRKAIYSETQRLISENLPFIYLVNPYSLAAVRDRLSGVEFTALGGIYWNIEELKVTSE